MKIVGMSDLHNSFLPFKNIPEGDVLIIPGDFSYKMSSIEDAKVFNEYLFTLTYQFQHILVIAGNHELLFPKLPLSTKKELLSNATYLEDEEIIIDGKKFYGSPWQPGSYDWAYTINESIKGTGTKYHWM
jgi:hypothetical protein